MDTMVGDVRKIVLRGQPFLWQTLLGMQGIGDNQFLFADTVGAVAVFG